MTAPERPQITAEVIAELQELEDHGESPGWCRACGHITDGIEPDAERYNCDNCDQPAVNGIEIVMLDYSETA